MRNLILFFTLSFSSALAQPELPLPLLYTVTGVAADDTLNVRETPNAHAEDVGDLLPGQTVEVLELSDDGKWGMVSAGENIGWVAARFLTLTQGTTGDGITLPYGVPLRMACSGTEPFWSAEIVSGKSFKIINYSEDNPRPTTYAMQGMSKPVNIGPYVYGFISPPVSGVIRREICDDGMSDSLYGWSIDLLRRDQGGVFMLTGCCSAVQP